MSPFHCPCVFATKAAVLLSGPFRCARYDSSLKNLEAEQAAEQAADAFVLIMSRILTDLLEKYVQFVIMVLKLRGT